jgi:hypothetical protein
MKKIKYILAIIIISTIGYGLYKTFNKPIVVEPSPIDLIMQEPAFQASMKIQAENIHLDRQREQIEKRKQELRKQELELASSTSLK